MLVNIIFAYLFLFFTDHVYVTSLYNIKWVSWNIILGAARSIYLLEKVIFVELFKLSS